MSFNKRSGIKLNEVILTALTFLMSDWIIRLIYFSTYSTKFKISLWQIELLIKTIIQKRKYVAIQDNFDLFLRKLDEALKSRFNLIEELICWHFFFGLPILFFHCLLQLLGNFCRFSFSSLLSVIIRPTGEIYFVQGTIFEYKS